MTGDTSHDADEQETRDAARGAGHARSASDTRSAGHARTGEEPLPRDVPFPAETLAEEPTETTTESDHSRQWSIIGKLAVSPDGEQSRSSSTASTTTPTGGNRACSSSRAAGANHPAD